MNRQLTEETNGEIHGSGRTRAKRKRCGASNVRAAQGNADEAGTHGREVQKSRACEKGQPECDSLSKVAHETVTTKTAHHEMRSAAVWMAVCLPSATVVERNTHFAPCGDRVLVVDSAAKHR